MALPVRFDWWYSWLKLWRKRSVGQFWIRIEIGEFADLLVLYDKINDILRFT